MHDTNGMTADARKRLEPEWVMARQRMYEPRPATPAPEAPSKTASDALLCLGPLARAFAYRAISPA